MPSRRVSHVLQDAAAYLEAAAAFQHHVRADVCKQMVLALNQGQRPSMQPLSWALLALARMDALPASCGSSTASDWRSTCPRSQVQCWVLSASCIVQLQSQLLLCAGKMAAAAVVNMAQAWLLLQLRSDAGVFDLPESFKTSLQQVRINNHLLLLLSWY